MKMSKNLNLDYCIFGWTLFSDIDIPVAYHTGIILKWNPGVWDSIVAHYGSDCHPRVLVETLKDAVLRSEVKVVRINPHYRAHFNGEPFTIDEHGKLHPSDELLEFEEEHLVYNVISSNCQHFVRRFVGDIPIESDMFTHLTPIVQNIIHTAVLGRQNDIRKIIEDVAKSYNTHRETGICAWDPDLDLHVPSFK